MAIGILRVRNLKMNELNAVQKHNAREYKEGKPFPPNIDKNRPFYQTYYDRGNDETNLKLKELIQKRIKEDEIKTRKNTNVAIEIVLTINDKKVWDNYDFRGFNMNARKFLEDKFGKDSVVAKYEHLDESNPHVHFVVMPTVKKKVKWKNQTEQGETEEIRIDTRSHTGGAKKLRKFQDEYYNFLMERYDKGNKLGVEIYRGTLKENQTRKYIERTDHKIGALRSKLSDLTDEIEKYRAILEIKEKQAEKVLKQAELENLKKKDDPKWKTKGTGLNNPEKGFFHT